MLTLGIDDAGRGPVLGPMVLAGVLVDEKTSEEYKKIGVKDSKDITPKRREFLAEKIKKSAIEFKRIKVSPEKIDSSLTTGTNLNSLEAIKIAKIINLINSNPNRKLKVIVDCPSTNISSWTDFLKTKVENLSNLEISCEHKADRNHISVSAASILAKQKREDEVGKLKKEFGEIGSGYPSDPVTCKFLEKNADKLKDKNLFRKTWQTYKNAIQKSNQMKLEF